MSKTYDCIGKLGGEVRIQVCQESKEWVCVIALQELSYYDLNRFNECWEDLRGGFAHYDIARSHFESFPHSVINYGKTPVEAFKHALLKADKCYALMDARLLTNMTGKAKHCV